MLGLKYKKARQELAPNEQFTTVDNRPYYPHLYADTSLKSVANVCCIVLGMENFGFPDLNVNVVSGGITNSLFRVSGFLKLSIKNVTNEFFDPSAEDSVLVRIFGGEGMIDRDEETATYAALCDAKIAYRYLGRFGNGRLEGWLNGFRPLQVYELSKPQISRLIAEKLAVLHTQFDLPGLKGATKPKPGLFEQLGRWMNQALNVVAFPYKHEADAIRADSLFNLRYIESELSLIQTGNVIPPFAAVAFCHNDLLAANIMLCNSADGLQIQLIDFEYGGYNYLCFDIANHFNEFAGGTQDAKPDYNLFPTMSERRHFLSCYLNAKGGAYGDEELKNMMAEVDAFVLVNHLYWGLWAVNQAKSEGCGEFDYLLYAHNRFRQFDRQKNSTHPPSDDEK